MMSDKMTVIKFELNIKKKKQPFLINNWVVID